MTKNTISNYYAKLIHSKFGPTLQKLVSVESVASEVFNFLPNMDFSDDSYDRNIEMDCFIAGDINNVFEKFFVNWQVTADLRDAVDTNFVKKELLNY
jgi:hypothetical protein